MRDIVEGNISVMTNATEPSDASVRIRIAFNAEYSK